MLLMLTQSLARDGTHKVRVMVGAIVASMIVPVSLFYPDSFLTTLFGKALYSVWIILVAFRFKNVYQTVKCLLLFYFTTFTIGGGLIALHFLLQSPIEQSPGGVLTMTEGFGTPISWVFVVIGFPIVWLFTKLRMDGQASDNIRYEQFVSVTMELQGTRLSTTALIDSGNQLVDPLTNYPVIIGDEYFMRQWFSEPEWQALKDASSSHQLANIPISIQDRLYFVPYQGVDGKRMLMLAIKPDQLLVEYEGQTFVTKKVLIGLQFAELTRDQSYHCLLHPLVLHFATVKSA